MGLIDRFLINLKAEIVACVLSFRKSRHKPNLENTSKYGFSPDLGGKNGGVLSMRMQVILDSSFARPGSVPIWGGKKGEFRDWTTPRIATSCQWPGPTPKSAIHGLPVTLRMFRVKSDKSDWFWSQAIVFTKPFKKGMSLDLNRGRDSWC